MSLFISVTVLGGSRSNGRNGCKKVSGKEMKCHPKQGECCELGLFRPEESVPGAKTDHIPSVYVVMDIERENTGESF